MFPSCFSKWIPILEHQILPVGALTPMPDEVFNLVLQMILNHNSDEVDGTFCKNSEEPIYFFHFINMEDGVEMPTVRQINPISHWQDLLCDGDGSQPTEPWFCLVGGDNNF